MSRRCCGVLVVARDEERVIRKCLVNLRRQTVELFLVVVNDGSVDETSLIASKYADVVVDLSRHKESWAGKPQLATVFNAGLDVLRQEKITYVVFSGADTIYPSSYVEEITGRMRNQNVYLASGVAKGETSRSLSPRGTGRVIDAAWFRRIGFKYPENYGFEVYLVYKALSEGKKVAVFTDLTFKMLRGTVASRDKLYLWGKGMKALNYWGPYALGRAILTGLKRPLNGLALLKGYASEVPGQYQDIREFVPSHQRRMLAKRFAEILRM